MQDFNEALKVKTDTALVDRINSVNIEYLTNEYEELRPKSKNASISLIIPVFQEEKIIKQTLQIYTKELREKYNIELIVSDGGSTDRTIEIAEKFANKITVHNEKRKQTIAEGRNKGALISKGDILVFMNGDTVPANPEKFFDKISKLGFDDNFYSNNIAFTCYVSVSPEEILIKDKVFYFIHNRYIRFLNFIGLGMGRGECQIVKSDYFNMVDGYDDSLAAGEDFDLFRRLAKIGKIGFMKDIIVYESPRRFRKYGYIKVIMSWIFNSLSVMIYGKSVSKDWEAVR